jgi:hypothetical protein
VEARRHSTNGDRGTPKDAGDRDALDAARPAGPHAPRPPRAANGDGACGQWRRQHMRCAPRAGRFPLRRPLPPSSSPPTRPPAVPGVGRLRDVLPDAVVGGRAMPGVRRGHLPPAADWPFVPKVGSLPRPMPVGVRAAYVAVAVLALGLMLGVTTLTPTLPEAQAAVQLFGSALLLVLAAAAASGLYRAAWVGHACTLIAAGLMLAPLLLPGPCSYAAVSGGLLAFWASGWAADGLKRR